MNKPLSIVLVLAGMWAAASPAWAQQSGAMPAPRCRSGVCAFLTDYVCCKVPFLGKPAPCAPACGYGVCNGSYCKKPLPCLNCFPLQTCPDCYQPKPAPVCLPKGPCPCPAP